MNTRILLKLVGVLVLSFGGACGEYDPNEDFDQEMEELDGDAYESAELGLEATPSLVSYCSQPVKVGVTYQYFVYLPAGTTARTLTITQGSISTVNTVFADTTAQRVGNDLTVTGGGALVLISSVGGALTLSGSGSVFQPRDKCGELIATTGILYNESEQSITREGDLIAAQVGLIQAMAKTAAASKAKDVKKPAITARTPAAPYYSAATILAEMQTKGLRLPQLKVTYENLIVAELTKYSLANGQFRESALLKAQTTAWLSEIAAQMTATERALLQKFFDGATDPAKRVVTPAEKAQVLKILVTKKIYRHPANTAAWYSMLEYFNQENKGVGVTLKLVDKVMSTAMQNTVNQHIASERLDGADLYDIESKTSAVPHLQVVRTSTGALLKETPLLIEINGYGRAAQVASYSDGTSLALFDPRKYGGNSFEFADTIVHEFVHVITKATGAEPLLTVGTPADFVSEGLAEHLVDHFGRHQTNKGFTTSSMGNLLYMLADGDYENRALYGESPLVWRWLREKSGLGRPSIDGLMAGTLTFDKIVDVNGLHTTLRTVPVVSVASEATSNSEIMRKAALKEIEINTELRKGNLANPSLSLVDKYISDLTSLRSSVSSTSRYAPSLTGYIDNMKAVLADYRATAPASRRGVLDNGWAQVHELRGRLSIELTQPLTAVLKSRDLSPSLTTSLQSWASSLSSQDKARRRVSGSIVQKTLAAARGFSSASPAATYLKDILAGAEPRQVAKRAPGGTAAVGTGMFLLLALGPKFADYGDDNNNPLLSGLGRSLETSGMLLFAGSAVWTVANAVTMAAPHLAARVLFVARTLGSGTLAGLAATAFVELAWCGIDPFGALCFSYVPPGMVFSIASGAPGAPVSYQVYGFGVTNGVGNRDGTKLMITYQGSYGLALGSGCTVSGGVCTGSFTAPALLGLTESSKTVKIWAQPTDASFKSVVVPFVLRRERGARLLVTLPGTADDNARIREIEAYDANGAKIGGLSGWYSPGDRYWGNTSPNLADGSLSWSSTGGTHSGPISATAPGKLWVTWVGAEPKTIKVYHCNAGQQYVTRDFSVQVLKFGGSPYYEADWVTVQKFTGNLLYETASNASPDKIAPDIEDAWVWKDSASSNYGSEYSLPVQNFSWAYGWEARALLKFDLSAQTAALTKAILRVTLIPQSLDPSAPTTLYVSRITSSWSESAVTWSTQPTTTTTNQVTVPVPANNSAEVRDIDITQLVKDMITSGNYGIMVSAAYDGAGSQSARSIRSREQSQHVKPQLIISY